MTRNTSTIVKIGNPHRKVDSIKVGKGESTKLLVNLGLSEYNPNFEIELEKYRAADKAGAHILADTTILKGKTTLFRRELLRQFSKPISTVPIYEAAMSSLELKGNAYSFSEEDVLSSIERQVKDGIDIMTLHASYRLEEFENLRNSRRILKITSRGGSFLTGFFKITNQENPIFKNFDNILDIAKDNGVVISLALALRSGCIEDQLSQLYFKEINTTSKLVNRALKAKVPVMVEGIGHTKLKDLPYLIKYIKNKCHNVPLGTLGPPVCDIATGMDDICSAIGGAVAASSGADFLGVITRREHIGIPSKKDIVDAIHAFTIATHVADIELPEEKERNRVVSIIRRDRLWSKLWKKLLFGEIAKKLRDETRIDNNGECTMCGDMCTLKLTEKIFERSEEKE